MIPMLLTLLPLYGLFDEALARERTERPAPETFLLACLALAALIALLNPLPRPALLIAWGLLLLLLSAAYLALRARRTHSRLPRLPRRRWHSPDPYVAAASGLISLLMLTLLLAGLAYPPALPLADSASTFSALVQRHLLTLSDAPYAALPAWFALLVAVIASARIAGRLGAGPRRQLIAAMLTVSIPAAVLQSTGLQPALTLAAALLLLLLALLALLDNPTSPTWTLASGLALGLALLAQPAAAVYLAPIVLPLAALYAWRESKRVGRRLLRPLTAILLLALLLAFLPPLISPPLSPTPAAAQHQPFSPAVLLSNLTRNFALQIAPNPARPNAPSNLALSWLQLAHHFSGFASADPSTQDVFQHASLPTFSETSIPNPLHLALTLLTMAAAAAGFLPRPKRLETALLLAGLLLAILLHAALLPWKPDGAGDYLPFLGLGAALTAVVLFQSHNPWLRLLPFLICAWAFLWAFNNPQRPLPPPTDPAALHQFDPKNSILYYHLLTIPEHKLTSGRKTAPFIAPTAPFFGGSPVVCEVPGFLSGEPRVQNTVDPPHPGSRLSRFCFAPVLYY